LTPAPRSDPLSAESTGAFFALFLLAAGLVPSDALAVVDAGPVVGVPDSCAHPLAKTGATAIDTIAARETNFLTRLIGQVLSKVSNLFHAAEIILADYGSIFNGPADGCATSAACVKLP
jgi:hypothetical protein